MGRRRGSRRKRTPGRRNDAKTAFWRRMRLSFKAPCSLAGLRRGSGGQRDGSRGAHRGLRWRRAGAGRRQDRARLGLLAAGGVDPRGALPGPGENPEVCGSQRAGSSGRRCHPRGAALAAASTPARRQPRRGAAPRGVRFRVPRSCHPPAVPSREGAAGGDVPLAPGGLNTARRDALPGASDRHRRGGPASKNNPLRRIKSPAPRG